MDQLDIIAMASNQWAERAEPRCHFYFIVLRVASIRACMMAIVMTSLVDVCVRAYGVKKIQSVCFFAQLIHLRVTAIYTKCLNSTNYPYGSRLRGP